MALKRFRLNGETGRSTPWGILDEATDVFFAVTWGETGWRSIFAQLIRIDKICSDLMNVLEKLVDPNVIRMQAAAKRRRDEIRGQILDEPLLQSMSSEQRSARGLDRLTLRTKQLVESSELAQEAEDAVSVGKKLDFIINKSERLSG